MRTEISDRPSPASAECRTGRTRDYDAIKTRGWRENGILVVNVTDCRLTWPERELIRQVGTKLYGIPGNDAAVRKEAEEPPAHGVGQIGQGKRPRMDGGSDGAKGGPREIR